MSFIKKFPLSILWIAFILFMCSIHVSSIPGSEDIHIPNVDKLVHFGFFFVLSAILFFESLKQPMLTKSRMSKGLRIILIAAIYGGGIELLQKYFIPYRSAEWLDFFADVAGSISALLLIVVIFGKKGFRNEKRQFI